MATTPRPWTMNHDHVMHGEQAVGWFEDCDPDDQLFMIRAVNAHDALVEVAQKFEMYLAMEGNSEIESELHEAACAALRLARGA